MNFKIALAAAAVVGLAGTAQAADLAKKAPAAANYVKVCDAYGAGYFYIPGSETCLKIGGFVRFQGTVYGTNKAWQDNRPTNIFGWRRGVNGISTLARADIQIDARTNTEMGLLRSYLEVIADNASYNAVNTGNLTGATNTYLSQGFIQFAGLTAGRAQSFFDYVGNYTLTSTGTDSPDVKVNLLAYTFSFGNGISASLSIEDPTTAWNTNPAIGTGATSFRRLGNYAAAGVTAPGGIHTPDLIANVNVAQAWGGAQLAVAYHSDDASTGTVEGSKAGFAVSGGVKINLPFLAAGDQFGIQGTYAKGAVGYVLTSWKSTAYDFTTRNGKIDQASGAGVYAGLKHNWTKTLASGFGFGYASFKGANSTADFNQSSAKANLAWTPVANLTITGEVGQFNDYYSTENKANSGKRNDGNTQFDLRIQRSF